VSNVGGSLTPLGDPPLFLGYLAGVPFTWTLRLAPMWISTTLLLLCIYYVWDTRLHRLEPPERLMLDATRIKPLRLVGKENLLLLGGIVVATAFLGAPWRELAMVALAGLSWVRTSKHIHHANHFTLHPIIEVAVVFLGIFLILLLSLQAGLFPTSGRGDWRHLVLPAVTLGAFAMASIARLTRSAMLEVLRADFVRTARAKGVSETLVVVKHTLRNAALPIITITGLQLGQLLAGAVVTETVFAWPGIGRLAIQSIYNRDYPIVQCTVFLSAASFVAINFFIDMLYAVIDPRIRHARAIA